MLVIDHALGVVDLKERLGAIQPSTAMDYRKSVRAWSPWLGGKTLEGLTREDVEQALASMLERVTPNTSRKRLVALSMALDDAVSRGLIPHNPVAGMSRPKKTLAERNPLTGYDLERLASLIATHPVCDWSVTAALCLYAGLRCEEACGLKVTDLEPARGWVRRAIAHGEGGAYVGPPKSGKARDFPVGPQLADVLARWESARPRGEWLTGGSRWLDPCTVGRKWSMLCEVEGYRGLAGRKPTMHDLRHTFATAMVRGGMDVKTLQSILGHSSAAVTLDVYASADPSAKLAARGTIAAALP